jgi:hypothetical protein
LEPVVGFAHAASANAMTADADDRETISWSFFLLLVFLVSSFVMKAPIKNLKSLLHHLLFLW